MDCIFCRIAKGDIPVEKVYEDERVIAFNDINPVAPVHILIIPKEHIESALDIKEDTADIIGYIFKAAKQVAKNLNIDENGFRIVNNCGKDGGQTVYHLHFHLLGGRELAWPPG